MSPLSKQEFYEYYEKIREMTEKSNKLSELFGIFGCCQILDDFIYDYGNLLLRATKGDCDLDDDTFELFWNDSLNEESPADNLYEVIAHGE